MPPIDQLPPGPACADNSAERTYCDRDPRKKTYLFGLLVHGDGAFTMDCVVRNISAGGAKIALAKRQPLPGELFLIVVKYGLACRAHVAWLSFPERGLKFADMHFLAQPPPQELTFLRELWLGLCPRAGGVPVVEPWRVEQRTALSGTAF